MFHLATLTNARETVPRPFWAGLNFDIIYRQESHTGNLERGYANGRHTPSLRGEEANGRVATRPERKINFRAEI
ncbi:hypothetical protein WN55_04883 [Dufourea novaeangliae]|uniref:Uncharacterized protein n=1 Tax=Dufourea novaeangliae TaxID=178035 RepID=A0A154PMA5_DUFNO|nr:hypothetical protein WN55_04883 [Dufourea novaeangliae]